MMRKLSHRDGEKVSREMAETPLWNGQRASVRSRHGPGLAFLHAHCSMLLEAQSLPLAGSEPSSVSHQLVTLGKS